MDGEAKDWQEDIAVGFMTLDCCNGPECQRCGCRDVQILQQPVAAKTWFPSGRARCRHCNLVFAFRQLEPPQQLTAAIDPDPVHMPPLTVLQPEPLSTRVDVMQPSVSLVVDPTRCPVCGSVAKAYSTKGRTQYRKCPNCGKKYKTMKEAG
jgi:hypothetical protein